MYYIWTDGSCLGNPGKGGWAAIIRYNDKDTIYTGAEHYTTNNKMEITAVIRALEKTPSGSVAILYSDSEYLIKGITVWTKTWEKNGWKTSQKKEVANKDLWQSLLHHNATRNVQWKWVKAHSKSKENNLCDTYAKHAAQSIKKNPKH